MELNPEDLALRIDITEPSVNYYLTPNGYVYLVVSVLTISSTVSSDSGEYSCNASNVVGISMTLESDEEVTTLFVQGKMKPS